MLVELCKLFVQNYNLLWLNGTRKMGIENAVKIDLFTVEISDAVINRGN